MLGSVLELASLLRRGGLRVSTAEVIDAVRAVDAAGVDRADLQAALRATLVKRAADAATFDELFALHVAGAVAGAGRQQSLADVLVAAGVDPARARDLIAALAARADGLGPVERHLAGVATPDLPAAIRAAGARVGTGAIASPLQVGAFTFRIMDALGAGAAAAAVSGMAGAAAGAGGTVGEVAALEALIAGGADRLRQTVRAFVEDELRRRRPGLPRQLAAATLGERPIAQLSAHERALLAVEVERLAQRLARRVRHRQRRPRRGRLDLRATLRASLATAGVPFAVRLHRRPRRPARLVVLCDISDSVRSVAHFFLHLVHALQARWERVQTFAFVADVGELTELFATTELHRAIELALAGAVVSPWTSSDYGRALTQFHARWAGRVGSRTTVIILGDARSNHQPARPAVLADLRRRARRVVWLNPEPPGTWGWGDSAMASYAPHCDRVATVWNLATLRAAVEDIAT
jgi:uncharacterized protein with von Willebrand factor type A (vWA) domain